MRAVLSLFIGLMLTGPAVAQSNTPPQRVAAVMAPLSFLPHDCHDYDGQKCSIQQGVMEYFDNLLAQARDAGVGAVSVDVWWRLVEGRGDNQFDWTYYDQIFKHIHNAGLKIVPILSFHRCGNGPNDDCDFQFPDWIWKHFEAQGLSPDDLIYESETGNRLDDALPPWVTARPEVRAQFSDFIHAFGQHYGSQAQDFPEVNISLGPTGELRYPSYNPNDCWNYPDRGNFQAYSRLAQQTFREWALQQFGGLQGVAARWDKTLHNADEIRVPEGNRPGGGCHGRRAQEFVDRLEYINTPYGKDFVDWYNQALVEHGRRLLLIAHTALDGAMGGVPLGLKVAGIHWQMTCTLTPRIAEITAGLVQSSLNLDPVAAARPDAFGYRNIMDMISGVRRDSGRPILLHFTDLEMGKAVMCPVGQVNDNTSLAQELVLWIAESAADRQITHRGENALPCLDVDKWNRITYAFQHYGYSGFTLFRLRDFEFLQRTGVEKPCGCEFWNQDTQKQYQQFISRCIANSCTIVQEP